MDCGQAVAERESLCSLQTTRIGSNLHCCVLVEWTSTSLSYCTTSGFRILASNYLGIDGGGNNPHPLCGEIEGLIESAEVTPAEVAEELMKSDDADGALQGLVSFLKRKKAESNKTEDESEGSTEKAKRQKTDEGEETE
ncbi:putative mitochondrial chaperone BCS1-A [Prunus yedoensis var. nudiflora]|uniref:Putative mitochondrial chaperone BCS1-A n=1 Tax=Prunus yedoensis var. nudiflora TaxID=2094558 RepID=A0A314USZ0_PRUYE|nr:putative mitochondrial chaperone BCS1-A [Prunus yedoensis var. nudiflora]